MKKTILTLSAILYSLISLAQTTAKSTSPINTPYSSTIENDSSNDDFMNVFVAPEKELIVIQIKNLNTQDLEVALFDANDTLIIKKILYQASTIISFDTDTLYSGDYIIKISDGNSSIFKKITLKQQ